MPLTISKEGLLASSGSGHVVADNLGAQTGSYIASVRAEKLLWHKQQIAANDQLVPGSPILGSGEGAGYSVVVFGGGHGGRAARSRRGTGRSDLTR